MNQTQPTKRKIVFASAKLLGVFAVACILVLALQLNSILPAQKHSKEAAVRGNLHAIEIAAESFKRLHGRYPVAVDEMKTVWRTSAEAPQNPYTNQREWPETRAYRDVSELRSLLLNGLPAGKLVYAPLATNDTYAVIGAYGDRHSGTILVDPGGSREVLHFDESGKQVQ